MGPRRQGPTRPRRARPARRGRGRGRRPPCAARRSWRGPRRSTTASARAAISRLRAGNRHGAGGSAQPYSDSSTPRALDGGEQRRVGARHSQAHAGAEHTGEARPGFRRARRAAPARGRRRPPARGPSSAPTCAWASMPSAMPLTTLTPARARPAPEQPGHLETVGRRAAGADDRHGRPLRAARAASPASAGRARTRPAAGRTGRAGPAGSRRRTRRPRLRAPSGGCAADRPARSAPSAAAAPSRTAPASAERGGATHLGEAAVGLDEAPDEAAVAGGLFGQPEAEPAGRATPAAVGSAAPLPAGARCCWAGRSRRLHDGSRYERLSATWRSRMVSAPSRSAIVWATLVTRSQARALRRSLS